jgi:hypothetical protein
MPTEAELKALYSRNENAKLENGLALELEALLRDDRESCRCGSQRFMIGRPLHYPRSTAGTSRRSFRSLG